jgi:hypothetical protein
MVMADSKVVVTAPSRSHQRVAVLSFRCGTPDNVHAMKGTEADNGRGNVENFITVSDCTFPRLKQVEHSQNQTFSSTIHTLTKG